MEIEFPFHLIDSLDDSGLEKLFNTVVSLLEKKFDTETNLARKQSLTSSIIIMYSKFFHLYTKISGKSLEPAKYTPARSNLLLLDHLMEEIQNEALDDREMLDQFARDFWIKCNCRYKCHGRVDFKQSYKIFVKYSSMSKIEDLFPLYF